MDRCTRSGRRTPDALERLAPPCGVSQTPVEQCARAAVDGLERAAGSAARLGGVASPPAAGLERHQPVERASAGRARRRSRRPGRPARAVLRATWRARWSCRALRPGEQDQVAGAEAAVEMLVERVETGRPDRECGVRAGLDTRRSACSSDVAEVTAVRRSTRRLHPGAGPRRRGRVRRFDLADLAAAVAGSPYSSPRNQRPPVVVLSHAARPKVPQSGRPAQVTEQDHDALRDLHALALRRGVRRCPGRRRRSRPTSEGDPWRGQTRQPPSRRSWTRSTSPLVLC